MTKTEKMDRPSSKIYFSKDSALNKEQHEDAGALKSVKAVSEYSRKAPVKTPKKSDSIKVIKLPRAYKPLRALDIDVVTGMPTLEEYVAAPHAFKGASAETKAKYEAQMRERQKKQADLVEAQLAVAKKMLKPKKMKTQEPPEMGPTRPASPGVMAPPPSATITDLKIFAHNQGIQIPSSITKKADIKAYIDSKMNPPALASPPSPPPMAVFSTPKGVMAPGSESGLGTMSTTTASGLKFKGRPRKEVAEVMAGKDIEKHLKKFKALMKKETAGSLTPIQSKRLESYKQLKAGGFFESAGKALVKAGKKALEYAMENPDKIIEFGTKYGPVAIDFLGKKKKDIFG